MRDERLYLMPGDSPMGYRLPLDSLPWAAPGDAQQLITQDPFDHLRPLPSAAQLRTQFGGRPGYDVHHVGRGFAEGGSVALQAQPWPQDLDSEAGLGSGGGACGRRRRPAPPAPA